MKDSITNIIIGFCILIFLVITIQILTGKFGRFFYYIILWYLISFLPTLVFIYKNNNLKYGLRLYLCFYITFLTIIFLLQPFYQPFLEVSFIQIITATFILIIPTNINLIMVSKNHTIIDLENTYLINGLEKELLLEYLGKGDLDTFFTQISQILSDRKTSKSNSFQNELVVLKSQWNEHKKHKNLNLSDSESLLRGKSKIVYSLIHLVSRYSN